MELTCTCSAEWVVTSTGYRMAIGFRTYRPYVATVRRNGERADWAVVIGAMHVDDGNVASVGEALYAAEQAIRAHVDAPEYR